MKKIIAFILTAGILLSLCACGNKRGGSKIETEPTEETVLSTEEQTVTTEAESETETQTETKAETTTEAKQKISPEECKAAYKAFLKDYIKDNKVVDDTDEGPKFALIYLDDDNIPELVIPQGHFHGAKCELYCYDGKEAKLLGEYGSWGGFSYRPESGVFSTGFVNQGGEETTYYKLENGAVTELGTFYSELKKWDMDPTNPENYNYFINEKPVTYEDYSNKEGEIREKYELEKMINTSTQEAYNLTESGLGAL
ncbi:MAG: hypothetical protein IKH13_07395 [Clostridia bacterium]|nr:hypothetical protein [Clostridia bacterium]